MATARHRGRQPEGGGGGAQARILIVVAAAAVVGSLTLGALRASLVKPGRIIQAAQTTGVYNTLPGVILKVISREGPLETLKYMNLSAEEMDELAQAAFPPEWVGEEIEAIVIDVAKALKSGGPISIELQLEPIKGDMAQAFAESLRMHAENIPGCRGGRPDTRLCKPDNLSAASFGARLSGVLPTVLEQIPDNYPLLAGPAAQGIASLQGVYGKLGPMGFALFLLAFGAGFVALRKKEEDTPLLYSAGVGLVGGSAVLLLIVFSVRSAALGGLASAIKPFEPAVVQTLTEFVSKGIGGGFTLAFVVLSMTLVGGGAALFMGREDK